MVVNPNNGIVFYAKNKWVVKPQMIWWKLKCILLSKSSQSEKAPYCVSSTIWNSGKGKTYGDSKIVMVVDG